MKILITISLILAVIIVTYIFYKVAVETQRKVLARLCEDTEDYITYNLGYVVFVDGNIGAGKTTLSAGITNMRSYQYQLDALDKINEIVNILYYVDFSYVDSVINLAFNTIHITNADMIISILYDPKLIDEELFKAAKIKPQEDFQKLFKGNYNDYLTVSSKNSLLRDYIDAELAILRNNYVYFPFRKFYSRITDNYSMPFLNKMYDLKISFEEKVFSVFRYSIIFDDEKALTKSNVNWQSNRKEDGGGDMFLRLIRQMGKEHITYITTIQNFGRADLIERELADTILHVVKCKVINPHKLTIAYYQFLIKLLNVALKIRLKFSKNKDKALKREKKIKKLKFNLHSKINYLNAAAFIRYQGYHYSSKDDYGKALQDCLGFATKFSLVFPLQYCYGSIDTFAYSVLYDVMSLNAINSSNYEDLIEKVDNDKKFKELQTYLEGVLERKNKKDKKEEEESLPQDDF